MVSFLSRIVARSFDSCFFRSAEHIYSQVDGDIGGGIGLASMVAVVVFRNLLVVSRADSGERCYG